MRKIFYGLFLLSISLLAHGGKPAQRVISLSPHTAELAYSAGLGDNLVGVSEGSNFPESVKSIEIVANYQGVHIEKILALKPDLVIGWLPGSYPREMAQLKAFGIDVVYAPIQKIAEIPQTLLKLGQWAQDPTMAQNNARIFEEALHQLKLTYGQGAPVDYFLQLDQKPLLSVNGQYWPTDVFRVCGGRNILEDSVAPYPQVNIEQVVQLQPQVIFMTGKFDLSQWQAWQQIPAVKHQRIWFIDPDTLSRPTMRSLQGIEQVCQYLNQVRQSPPSQQAIQ